MAEVKAENLQEKKQRLKNPVMLGVSVAANLGTILAESVIDSHEDALHSPKSSRAVAAR